MPESLNKIVDESQCGAVLDPFGGLAGDMLLGALVDLGADLAEIRKGLRGLNIEAWELSEQQVNRRHLAARKIDVQCTQSVQHRHLSDILRILRDAELPVPVLAGAEHTFGLLAVAEAKAHGVDPESVHFHEVGACDAILDICGVHYAMHLLGLQRFWVTALPSGNGVAKCAHGDLPCPVPATLRLLQGFDLEVGQGPGEMVTPTGAALVASLGYPLREPVGTFSLGAVGYGAGTREGSVCRMWRLQAPTPSQDVEGVMQRVGMQRQEVWAIACDIDDSDPQAMAYLCASLMQEGVLDVRLVPTQMKKGRAGQTLELLLERNASQLERVMRRIIQDSRTLGVRFDRQTRFVAPRQLVEVSTQYGEVQVKVAQFDWHCRAYPEYEDCAKRAAEHGVALSEVQRAALNAWEKQS